MTSEQKNCGLTSLLPVGCRGRAEAFARNLQTRLSSLGTHNSSSEERSWLGPHEKPVVALTQPILKQEKERCVDFDTLQSPCSPEEELSETELHRLLGKGSFKEESKSNGDCHCPKLEEAKFYLRTNVVVRHQSADSDNEVFYDLDDDPPSSRPYTNGLKNSESSKSIESETGIDVNSQATSSSNPSDVFGTSLDCTPQPSFSDDLSTLSLKDDGSILDVVIEDSICEGCEKNKEARNDKTDYRLSENDEGYVNGETVNEKDESEIYIGELKVDAEVIVECQINSEENRLEEIVSEHINDKLGTTIEENVVECQINSEENRLEEKVQIEQINDKLSTNINGEKDGDDGDDENDDDDDFIPRVRRCSSLKTGKTPPGTPGRKKIVRFADVLGLDLADVRTFLDEVPKVPKSAYNDLSDADLSDTSELNAVMQNTKYHGIKTDRILVPLFPQPAGLPNYLDLVRDNQVCLENALVEDPIMFLIKGTVRCRNLDFHKSVHIRYTLDSWKTFSDVQAVYVDNSCDGFSDRFSFKIYAHTLQVGQKLEFAVRFQCKGCQYWDANRGKNYCFQCLPSAANNTVAPIANHGLADWGASFY